MSEKDLQGFIQKVEQLKDMVQSLKDMPHRKELLASCKTHDDVVNLAKEWGYEIGQRWGEYI